LQHVYSPKELLGLIRWKETMPTSIFAGLLTIGKRVAFPVRPQRSGCGVFCMLGPAAKRREEGRRVTCLAAMAHALTPPVQTMPNPCFPVERGHPGPWTPCGVGKRC